MEGTNGRSQWKVSKWQSVMEGKSKMRIYFIFNCQAACVLASFPPMSDLCLRARGDGKPDQPITAQFQNEIYGSIISFCGPTSCRQGLKRAAQLS